MAGNSRGVKSWFISDRSGFRFRYRDRIKESDGSFVGPGESDGAYGIVNSPLNKSPRISDFIVLKDADLELLIYFYDMDLFTKKDYMDGTYAYSWDKHRWDRLLKEGSITVWRNRNRTTQKYNIYKVSFRCKQLIKQIYRIMLGEENLPTSTKRNPIMKGKTYSDKVLIKAINNVNKDKNR